jgi:hypothetical protein
VIRLIAAASAALAVAAMSPALLQFVDGKSTFAVDGIFVPSVHYIGIQMQQGRVQVDADWSEAQTIARELTSRRVAHKNIVAVMFDRAGNPFRVRMSDCALVQAPISIPIEVPAASPFPSGTARIIFNPHHAQASHVIVHCKRITSQ